MKNPYTILGIESGASLEEAKLSYLKRVKVLHPDRFDPQKQRQEWNEANEMLLQLNIAWEIVKSEIGNGANEYPPKFQTSKSDLNNSAKSDFGFCQNCGISVPRNTNFCSACGVSGPGLQKKARVSNGLSIIAATFFLIGLPAICFGINLSYHSFDVALYSFVKIFLFCLMPHVLIRFPSFFAAENSIGKWVIALGWFGNLGIVVQFFLF